MSARTLPHAQHWAFKAGQTFQFRDDCMKKARLYKDADYVRMAREMNHCAIQFLRWARGIA